MSETSKVAKQVVAAELLRLREVARRDAEKSRDAGLDAAAELTIAIAGVLSDLFHELTGRHPGEVD